jgi:hypothetical protein
MEEYRWEPGDIQPILLRDEPPPVGDERWNVLLAVLTLHLTAQHNLAPPAWAEMRVLQRPWFPAELCVQRADALVRAPAAFRKPGVVPVGRRPGGSVTEPGSVERRSPPGQAVGPARCRRGCVRI